MLGAKFSEKKQLIFNIDEADFMFLLHNVYCLGRLWLRASEFAL